MPIYEFFCPDNNKIYSFYARTLAMGDKTPRCPDNPAFRMQKQVSNFAYVGRAKDPATLKQDAPLDEFDDPRMEQLMAEMEHDMAGMNEENPDPRQMASMLRKMTGIMGDKVPAEMNEMISRMEKGEDPEKLEEEYGDVIENAMGEDGMLSAPDNPQAQGQGRFRKLLAGMRQPTRDPELYEMSDYV